MLDTTAPTDTAHATAPDTPHAAPPASAPGQHPTVPLAAHAWPKRVTQASTPTAAAGQKPPFRMVIVGHVDHGKSTLIGRLLGDTDTLPDGKVDAIKASCARRGVPFEWAFVMDALKSERDQNITIDTAHIWFNSAARRYVIIDAPGHAEFLKNMITGAADAQAAVLLIAADEGLREQSRRHALLLSLLGIRDVVVVVNKIDKIEHSRAVFDDLVRESRAMLTGLGLEARAFIPVGARDGENVVERAARTPWYAGPTVLEALDAVPAQATDADRPLRLPVQDVYRFDDRRIIAGRIDAGALSAGDEVVFWPHESRGVVKSLEAWPEGAAADTQRAGDAVGFTVDTQRFAERGHVVTRASDPAPTVSDRVFARVFWMGKAPLVQGKTYTLKLGTDKVRARVSRIDRVLDTATLTAHAQGTAAAQRIGAGDVGEVTFAAERPLVFDPGKHDSALGRLVVVDAYDVVGGGIIEDSAQAQAARVQAQVQPGMPAARPAHAGRVSRGERAARFGHAPAWVVVHAAPDAPEQPSTTRQAFAASLERALFDRGAHAVWVDHPPSAQLWAAGLITITTDSPAQPGGLASAAADAAVPVLAIALGARGATLAGHAPHTDPQALADILLAALPAPRSTGGAA